MDDEVELAPKLLDLAEDRVDRRAVGDVAMADDMAAELLRQRLDPLLQGVALIGEGELGAGIRRRLGDTPGDRAVVGDAHDETALAPQEVGGRGGAAGFRHLRPSNWTNRQKRTGRSHN